MIDFENAHAMADALIDCRCPICRRPIDDPIPREALRELPLAKTERALIEAVVSAHPRPVRSDFLIERMWGDDPDGGPLNSKNAVSVYVNRVNKYLRPLGWEITAARRLTQGGRIIRRIAA